MLMALNFANGHYFLIIKVCVIVNPDYIITARAFTTTNASVGVYWLIFLSFFLLDHQGGCTHSFWGLYRGDHLLFLRSFGWRSLDEFTLGKISAAKNTNTWFFETLIHDRLWHQDWFLGFGAPLTTGAF
jgi:hypothetical protein